MELVIPKTTIEDIFTQLNAEVEEKKQKEKLVGEKLYYNAQQQILLEFHLRILKETRMFQKYI